VRFVLRDATALLPAGHEVAWDQFELDWRAGTVEAASRPVSDELAITHTETTGMHLLSGGGGSGGEAWTLGIDRETGRLRSWVIGGFELLHAPLEAAFWRPPTDNDLGTSKPTGTTVAWLALERGPVRLLNSSLEEVKWDGLESSALRWCATTEPIAALHKEPPLVQTCYTVGQGGEVLVSQTLRRRTSPLPNLPRFGVRFALTGGMRELEWLGRGPNENYWDRKRGSRLGLHAAPILNMTVPYLRPQECLSPTTPACRPVTH